MKTTSIAALLISTLGAFACGKLTDSTVLATIPKGHLKCTVFSREYSYSFDTSEVNNNQLRMTVKGLTSPWENTITAIFSSSNTNNIINITAMNFPIQITLTTVESDDGTMSVIVSGKHASNAEHEVLNITEGVCQSAPTR